MPEGTHRVQVSSLGRLGRALEDGLADLEKNEVVRRIWALDWTVWGAEDREVSNRLGWLDSPRTAAAERTELEGFAGSLRSEGLERAVVLGMGGSSLAPDVFARLYPTSSGALELEILDTTEPATVAASGSRLDPARTLFVASSKSGTTAELAALFSYFYDRARRRLGEAAAGSRFVAVTDPGTPLEALARALRFRRVFSGTPDIGGRFSALSSFGLLPAAIKGVSVQRLLASAAAMAEECRNERPRENPGAFLGALLGTAAAAGADKLTLLLPPRLLPLAGWLEQLVAESTGKSGRGIVPLIGAWPGPKPNVGRDRLFVEISAADEPAPDEAGRILRASGMPFIQVPFDDLDSLGGQFFLWEFATAVAGHCLKVNPFDQPDVESTKTRTREVLADSARLKNAVSWSDAMAADGLRFITPEKAGAPARALERFLEGAREGDYLAILAFLPYGERVGLLLEELAGTLRTRTRLPVTVGFGPRYLHSTGQLHKGGGRQGRFLMLAETGMPEVPIPLVPGVSRPAAAFADLFSAQAWGDFLALRERGRPILRVDIDGPVEAGLERLRDLL